MNMILSLLLLASSVALSQAKYSCDTYCAYSAVKNAAAPAGSVERTSFYFDEGQFPPSVYNAQDGACGLQVYVNEDTITITGVVYGSDPSTGFFMNIQGNRNKNTQEAYEELTASSYVANGGSIDPSTWYFYSLSSAALTGFGAYQGTLIPLMESMHPLQVGYGANGKNFNFGLSAWFDYNINGKMYMTDINVDIVCKEVPQPTCSPAYNITGATGDYAVTFRNTADVETKFNFIDPSGIFMEDATLASAVVGGQIRRVDGTGEVCTFALLLTRDTAYNTPHQELSSSAYKVNGGPIDPTTWRYYSLVSGSVTCPSSSVTLATYEGMDLQVGFGANDKNYNFGASAWYEFTNTTSGDHGIMDINVDLVCGPLAPTPAPPTPAPTPIPPTDVPTPIPTDAPTPVPPTDVPTPIPTDAPTPVPPTDVPTPIPTDAPTPVPPTDAPTPVPVTPAPSDTGAATSSDNGATTNNGATTGTGAATTGSGSTTGGSYTCPPNPYVAQQAIADQYGANSYFSVIFNDTGIDTQWRFIFENNAGTFIINEQDGTAALYGTLTPIASNPDNGLFDFNIDFYIGFNPAPAPAEYHKELHPDAYVPNGPVDPTTWRFFSYANSTSTAANTGYTLNIVPYMNMAFQIGAGANGKNVNYGASDWFSFFLVNSENVLVSSGVADVNIDLVCQPNSNDDSQANGSASGSAASNEPPVTIGTGQGQATAPPSNPATTAGAATVTISMLVFAFALILNL